MKLNKRYFRSIKSNVSFYVSSTILTIMTLFLFFMMNIAGKSIWEFGDNFFETQNVEIATVCFTVAIFLRIFIWFLKVFTIILTAMLKKVFNFTAI